MRRDKVPRAISQEQLCDQAAEAAVLGSMIQDCTCIPAVLELLAANSFYRPEHKTIFDAIQRVRASNAQGVIDGVLLRSSLADHDELEGIGGLDYLRAVVESTPTSVNAVHYAKRVAAKVLYRKAVAAHEYMGKVLADGGEPGEQIEEWGYALDSSSHYM